MMIIWVILALIVVGLGYIRLAPGNPEIWHVMPEATEDKDFANGAIRHIVAGPDGLAQLDAIATASAQTERLFGTVQEGLVTYVTRTAVFGFPDYTTIGQSGETLTIYARARFGKSDFGVNRDRVQTWIDALQAR